VQTLSDVAGIIDAANFNRNIEQKVVGNTLAHTNNVLCTHPRAHTSWTAGAQVGVPWMYAIGIN